MTDIKQLCNTIRELSYSIHSYLRFGHLEKVYENALIHRLQKQGISCESQYPLHVMDEDGTVLGNFYADLFVDNRLIVEIKACKSLLDEHFAQILGYLRASRIEHGLIVNFGAPKLQIKKFIMNNGSSDRVPVSFVNSVPFCGNKETC
ncbi:GxxExxY protein [Kamptonema cortianum]|nr:GxxExxY protein [Oscillatoria laete-virens]MDK3156432.1 GxxExxY protein [Kamptonema cortianum]MDL5046291.1 GxxExxY protein [Oscillatoria amoena NRMC-F 0135]MDL5053887.1 GxxExxY protein [Oscillatoria laete-virens NRMC-F 0139]